MAHIHRNTSIQAYQLRAGGSGQWYSHHGEEFRGERDYSNIIKHGRHTGYYTDCDGQDTAIGIVAMLTHGRFIAGYRWTENDERVYFPDVFTDETDAARMADEHARVFADSAREHSERFKALQLAEFDVESRVLELEKSIALRHRAKFGGRPRVLEHVQELRAARESLAAATREYERAGA